MKWKERINVWLMKEVEQFYLKLKIKNWTNIYVYMFLIRKDSIANVLSIEWLYCFPRKASNVKIIYIPKNCLWSIEKWFNYLKNIRKKYFTKWQCELKLPKKQDKYLEAPWIVADSSIHLGDHAQCLLKSERLKFLRMIIQS